MRAGEAVGNPMPLAPAYRRSGDGRGASPSRCGPK